MNSGIKKTDFLIVGAGIAGTTLALELNSLGKSVHVTDLESPNSSSRIAAGILNPVVPKGVTCTWQIESIYPAVFDYYRKWEQQTGSRFIKEIPFITLHKTEDEYKQWAKKYEQEPMKTWIEPAESPTWQDKNQNRGASNTKFAGRLDVADFLKSSKRFLIEQGVQWNSESFLLNDTEEISFFDNLRLNNINYNSIVFCLGINDRLNPLFPGLFFDPTGGDILTVSIPGLPQECMLKRGLWLVPIGGECWLAGSNFHKGDISEHPQPQDAQHLLEQLSSWIPYPIELITHRRGVRPTVQNRRPYLGRSPLKEFHYCYIFNGLGSKGSSLCSWLSPMMAAFLCGSSTLHKEVDIRRFYKN